MIPRTFHKRKTPVKRGVLTSKNHSDLVKLLDKEVSFYIRTAQGMYCHCYTCGAINHYKNMDAGHYIPRHRYGTRWNLNNIRPQCTRCNSYHEGEHWLFRKNLVEEIGDAAVKELEYTAELHGERHSDRGWLVEQIVHFRKLNAIRRKELAE